MMRPTVGWLIDTAAHVGGIPEIVGSVVAIGGLLALVWYGTRKTTGDADDVEDAEP